MWETSKKAYGNRKSYWEIMERCFQRCRALTHNRDFDGAEMPSVFVSTGRTRNLLEISV